MTRLALAVHVYMCGMHIIALHTRTQGAVPVAKQQQCRSRSSQLILQCVESMAMVREDSVVLRLRPSTGVQQRG